jgi:hypothetical protein
MNHWLADGDYVLEVDPFPTGLAPTEKRWTAARSRPFGQPESLQAAANAEGDAVERPDRGAGRAPGAPVVNLSMMVDAGYASDSHDAGPGQPVAAHAGRGHADPQRRCKDQRGAGSAGRPFLGAAPTSTAPSST